METRGDEERASRLRMRSPQDLLILRSEATAEPRRRGGFAIVPLAREVGKREAQAR
jgi:hypothetical protein